MKAKIYIAYIYNIKMDLYINGKMKPNYQQVIFLIIYSKIVLWPICYAMKMLATKMFTTRILTAEIPDRVSTSSPDVMVFGSGVLWW